MQIVEVDPHDERAFGQWFAVVDAWQQDEHPGEPGWTGRELRELALHGTGPDPDERVDLLVAVDDGLAVGAARVELPRRDNLHLANLLLLVHPEHRRRGAGRRLAEEGERRAREAGRSTLTAVSEESLETHGSSPARGFGAALGFTAVQEEVRRDIDLPLDRAVVSGLAAVAAQSAGDYEVRTWRDAVPEELLEDQAHLHRRMSVDIPMADMDWREEEWDAARVRRNEEQIEAMGRTWFGAGAVHRPTGRLVAYTTIGVPRELPERAYQWDTLVLTEHRGHRLGTLIKLACLERLHEESPATRYVSTWNAAENLPMIRVNDALGARVAGILVNWQKRLS